MLILIPGSLALYMPGKLLVVGVFVAVPPVTFS